MWLGFEACLLGESKEAGGLQQRQKPLRECGRSSAVPRRAQEQVNCVPWAQPWHKHQGWRNWHDKSIVVQRMLWRSDSLWELSLSWREGDWRKWRESCIELVQLPKSLCLQLEVTKLPDLESICFSTIQEMVAHRHPEQNETKNLTPAWAQAAVPGTCINSLASFSSLAWRCCKDQPHFSDGDRVLERKGLTQINQPAKMGRLAFRTLSTDHSTKPYLIASEGTPLPMLFLRPECPSAPQLRNFLLSFRSQLKHHPFQEAFSALPARPLQQQGLCTHHKCPCSSRASISVPLPPTQASAGEWDLGKR